MKSTTTTLAIGAFLTSLALAQPHHRQHQAFHNHEKRDGAVTWVTNTVIETEIVDVTTTIWVSEGYVAATTSVEASTSSEAALPAQFFQPLSSSSVAPVPTPSSSSSVVVALPASTPSSTTPEPTPSPSTSVAAAAVETPVPAAVNVAVVESSASPVATTASPVATTASPVEAATSVAVVAPAASSAAASSSSSSSSSSSGSGVTGTNTGTIFMFGSDSVARETFWVSGSCGLSTYFASDVSSTMPLVAFPSQVMTNYGASQNNKLCGKVAHLTSGGKTIDVVVADTNVSVEDSIDMTLSVWEFFGHQDNDGSHVGFEISWVIDA